MRKLFQIIAALGIVVASPAALAKYSCSDEAVRRALVRHLWVAENVLDGYPTDAIRLTGILNSQRKSGAIKWGAIHSWALAPSATTKTVTIEKTDKGTAGVRILLCGYTWPGTKEEWKEKLKVETVKLMTTQTTRLEPYHKPGVKVALKHTPATETTRTIYVLVMEPESRFRSVNYNITDIVDTK